MPQPPKDSRIDLGEVTHHNVKQLRLINQIVFPVVYNDKFYKDVLEMGELAKLCYFNDIVVGGVCCRADLQEPTVKKLYIMTLGCLAPYRRMGIGTKLLEHVLAVCQRDATFEAVYLHVQINNEDALEFYKKHGFVVTETCENYYKRILPADAYLLQKSLKAVVNGVVENNDTANSSP